MTTTIEDEWETFLNDIEDSKNRRQIHSDSLKQNRSQIIKNNYNEIIADETKNKSIEISNLHISTQTKSIYLNQEISIENLFWSIYIMPYHNPTEGVVKKQFIVERTNYEDAIYFKQQVAEMKEEIEKNGLGFGFKYPPVLNLKHENIRRTAKYKFHLSIGMSRKNFKKKSTSVFSHCVALTVRIWFRGVFEEIHVKIFNTGKIEIPGKIASDSMDIIKNYILYIIKSNLHQTIYQMTNEPIVFINSNFSCNYNINRQKLYTLLTEKYQMITTWDMCKFHGVKCCFYYNRDIPDMRLQNGRLSPEDMNLTLKELSKTKKYIMVHFICYQTGKCLITGKCSEPILKYVYEFFSDILTKEYKLIYEQSYEQCMADAGITAVSKKTKSEHKKRTIKIQVSRDYYEQLVKGTVNICITNTDSAISTRQKHRLLK